VLVGFTIQVGRYIILYVHIPNCDVRTVRMVCCEVGFVRGLLYAPTFWLVIAVEKR